MLNDPNQGGSGPICRLQLSHDQSIKPIVDAAPDVRKQALDRWKESGEELPNAKPAARLAWMVNKYGYHPEEVQSPYLRPAGWVYEAIFY